MNNNKKQEKPKNPFPEEKREIIDLIDDLKVSIGAFVKRNAEVLKNYDFICPDPKNDKNKPTTSASLC